jgi:hypothetical protein
MKVRFLWYGWGVCLLVLVTLLAFPIRTGKIRMLIAALLAVTWLGLCALLWIQKHRLSAAALLISGSALAGWIACGSSSPVPADELRALYITRLRHYDGVTYVYGGENSLGIDCSGLVRCALWDSFFISGIHHVNAGAIREALRLWWNDSSALDLGEGAGGVTLPQLAPDGSPTLPMGSNPSLQAGDLVVSGMGSHVLAYIGNGEWIEAEPGVGRTHIFTLTGPLAFLAKDRVRFVRWKCLANP